MELFIFKTWEDREGAENNLYDEFGGYVYDRESVYNGYGLVIREDCKDYEKAWRICKKWGGELER